MVDIATPLSRREMLRISLALGGTLCLPAAGRAAASAPLNERLSGDLAPVHDPCIIKADGLYHVFSTGQQAEPSGLIPWRTSKDLAHWTLRGRVFDAIPRWARDAVPGTRGLWAPDIARFNDQYHLYYSCSTFGSNHSVIGLVTNATLDPASPQFEWRDRGLVVSSERGDDFNAIDPNHFVDRDGAHWLCLGSFWSGIKLFRIDPATGKPPPGELRMHSLASRPVPEELPAPSKRRS